MSPLRGLTMVCLPNCFYQNIAAMRLYGLIILPYFYHNAAATRLEQKLSILALMSRIAATFWSLIRVNHKIQTNIGR